MTPKFLKFLFILFLTNQSLLSFSRAHKFLQNSSLGRSVLAISSVVSSSAFGLFCRTKASKVLINPFLKQCQKENCPVDITLFEKKHNSFSDFFTRKFVNQETQRPFIDEKICSPVEAMLTVIDDITLGTHFFVKGVSFSLTSFLRNFDTTFTNAKQMLIFRLRIGDYHRFHAPCNLKIIKVKKLGWKLLSVQPEAFTNDQNPLLENSRKIITCIDDQNNKFLLVAVGAFNIGSIKITAALNKDLKQGTEIGFFAPGGSCLVMIYPSLKITTSAQEETFIKLGQEIGSLT